MSIPNTLTPPTFTILLKAEKKRVEGLTVEGTIESEGQEASVVFTTKAGKKWKLHLSEFSFVFPATKPEPQPQPIAA